MSSFTKPLVVSPVDHRLWCLMEPFEYHAGTYPSEDVIYVPAGYETDFASVPRLFWNLLPPWGKYGKAAVIHDYLCDIRDRPSPDVHAIFYEAMGVLGVSLWKRQIMYRAVRLFGPRF